MSKKKQVIQKTAKVVVPFLGRKVQLHDLRLLAMSARHQILPDESGNLQMPDEVKQTINLRAPNAVEGNDIIYAVNLSLVGKNGDDQLLLEVTAAYGVVYRFDSLADTTTEEIHRFGQMSCLFHVWPFWREYVHSTMTRLGLPTFLVPLLYPGGVDFELDEGGGRDEKTSPKKKRGR